MVDGHRSHGSCATSVRCKSQLRGGGKPPRSKRSPVHRAKESSASLFLDRRDGTQSVRAPTGDAHLRRRCGSGCARRHRVWGQRARRLCSGHAVGADRLRVRGRYDAARGRSVSRPRARRGLHGAAVGGRRPLLHAGFGAVRVWRIGSVGCRSRRSTRPRRSVMRKSRSSHRMGRRTCQGCGRSEHRSATCRTTSSFLATASARTSTTPATYVEVTSTECSPRRTSCEWTARSTKYSDSLSAVRLTASDGLSLPIGFYGFARRHGLRRPGRAR